jgi:Bacterial PH domain
VADVTRYLLPSERPVISIRRHWAVIAGATLQSLVLFTLGVLLVRFSGDVGFLRMLAVYFCVFVFARWLWQAWEWRREIIVVTDKRLLLVTGIVTRNLAIMPLVKVTDLTFHRSSTGLLLGYGKFIVESAGQDQALSTIDYVPRAENVYLQISELLFGGEKGAPGAMVTAAQYEASEEEEREVRSRWRRFASVRRRGRGWTAPPDQTDGPPEPSPATNRLDDLLARRDTLLADRDEPQYERYEREEREERDPGGELPERRRTEPTRPVPRIHEPGSRNSGAYDNGYDQAAGRRPDDPQLPPPRRPRDAPPPRSDPADD